MRVQSFQFQCQNTKLTSEGKIVAKKKLFMVSMVVYKLWKFTDFYKIKKEVKFHRKVQRSISKKMRLVGVDIFYNLQFSSSGSLHFGLRGQV